MGILEKISEIEKEIARTQKNKGLRPLLLLSYADVMYNNTCCAPCSYRISLGAAESETCKVPFATIGTLQESWRERRRL
jgi:hypothetical protein